MLKGREDCTTSSKHLSVQVSKFYNMPQNYTVSPNALGTMKIKKSYEAMYNCYR